MIKQKLSAEVLKNLIKKDLEIKIFDSLESTNITAKKEAENGAPEGGLIIAHSQTGGRGRLGRSFYSPKNSGIYMSIILRPTIPAEDISLITPLAALAVCFAIEKVTRKAPEIKWVNDIFVNGKKVCGILSEAAFSSDSKGAKYVILGIGINLFAPVTGFPKDIKNIAGGLMEPEEDIDINLLLSHIIKDFFELYESPKSVKWVVDYSKRLMLKGREITYLKNRELHKGTVVDINKDFHLIIKNEAGESEYLQSGEVTVGSNEAVKNEL